MNLKLLVFATTYVLLVYGNDVERKDNVESYITKEAARELRNKLSARGEQQDHDYDEILKRIIMSVQQSNGESADQVVYEKKYFDYLPNDLDSEDVTDEDSTHELVKSFGGVMPAEHETSEDNARRVNSRKFKRDLTDQSRAKRQKFQPYPAASSLQSRYSQVNPWSSPNNLPNFHRPGNFYLPAKPVNNIPSPPRNPTQNTEFVNRGVFEEDDSPQRVWSIYDKGAGKGGTSGNTIKTQTRPPPATRPPPQTTTTPRPQPSPQRPYQETFNSQSAQEDIQYVVELPEDDFEQPSTTRAPLRRPTISKSKNPDRNQATQKKEVPTTTTTRTVVQSPKPDRNSRNQNKTVPACVLAIVQCCSKYDDFVRTPCFEKFNCNGAFFGRSPCSPDIKAAAFREVEKFSRR